MGYFVKDRYCDGREYEIFEANDSLSKFRDIGELDEFFAQLTSAPTLRFDNEGTAEIVINGLATGMMKHKMFHLCSSHHWGLFSNESLESINTDVLFSDLDKFLPYNFLNETQKITVLNRLLPRVAFPLDEVICAGETTNGITIRGMKIRSGDKTIEAELHYRNDAHGNNRQQIHVCN